MASGADAHISIDDKHARFKSERLRAGGSGELLARRQETAYINHLAEHACRIVQQSAQLSLIESSRKLHHPRLGPRESSPRDSTIPAGSWEVGNAIITLPVRG
jgi:hypothetical protein